MVKEKLEALLLTERSSTDDMLHDNVASKTTVLDQGK
jgi:hypothetical protein